MRLTQIRSMDYGTRQIAVYFPKLCMDPLIRLRTDRIVIDIHPALVDEPSGQRIGEALIKSLARHQLSDVVKQNVECVEQALPLPRRNVMHN